MNMNKTLAAFALSASLIGGCCTACFKGTCNTKSNKPTPAAAPVQPVVAEPKSVLLIEPAAASETAVAVQPNGWGVWAIAGGLVLGGAALLFLTHRKK